MKGIFTKNTINITQLKKITIKKNNKLKLKF